MTQPTRSVFAAAQKIEKVTRQPRCVWRRKGDHDKKAQLWISHDKPQSSTVGYAPAYYD